MNFFFILSISVFKDWMLIWPDLDFCDNSVNQIKEGLSFI